jgi:hypothetical protein
MADEYALTSRFKIPVPVLDSTSWLDYLTHWAEMMDVMFTALSVGDYVISGLAVTTESTSLDFSYGSGSVSINSSTVDITSGNGSATASAFNWVYIQGGVVKISIYPPTGASYVPLASLQTDATGVVGYADLRPSPPTVNGISITPFQVNPTSNINMAAGKKIIHADSGVGSNTVMFSDTSLLSILSWGNQTIAKDWETFSVSAYVTPDAKFAILNCYIATLDVVSDGWAVLEVKTETTDADYVYNFVDYGHPSASVLNAFQRGQTQQIILPLTSDKKFQARSLIDSLGGSGKYYALIKIMGYVV